MTELSFKINGTKQDAKNLIKNEYNKSLYRKRLFNHYYAVALFEAPDKIFNIKNKIAYEDGYQKAIKNLAKDFLQLV